MIIANINTEPYTEANIIRARGDTKKIWLTVTGNTLDNPSVVDLTLWEDFYLTVDPSSVPETDINNVDQMVGEIEDATIGLVSFIPSADVPVGKYYFDIQATDGDGGIYTLVKGAYKLVQDITKLPA